MKVLQSFVYFLVTGFIFLSCNSNQEASQSALASSFSLEVVDTVEVDYLGQLMLMAIAPNGQTFLCMDWQRQEFIFLDRASAKIVSSFSKSGDRPDNPGWGIRAPSFFDNSSMLIGGTNGVFIFDLEGEVVQKYSYLDQPNPGILYMNAGSYIHPSQIDGEEVFIFPTTDARSAIKTERAFYENWRSISVYYPESKRFAPKIHLPANSRYFDGMVYEQSHLMSTFTLMDNRLWLSLGADPVIRAYDVNNDFTLVAELYPPLLNYISPEGVKPADADPNSVVFEGDLGGIKNIFAYKDDLALVYFPGFSQSQKEALSLAWQTGGEDTYEELYQQFKKVTPTHLLIMSQEGEVKADIAIPPSLEGGDLLIQNDEIWIQAAENKEQEEDVVRFFRLELSSIQ